ncbi:MAG: DUF2029 domain-containing protein [Chloroflexi bacterium]|nr:DUF2029 domain-containing protein [Chloroflexota bacterium]
MKFLSLNVRMSNGVARWGPFLALAVGGEFFYGLLAWAFPLPRLYARVPPVDFAKLTHYHLAAALGLLLAYVLLFGGLAWLMWSDRSPLDAAAIPWIWAGGGIFAVTLVFLYPIFAIDMLMYGVRTRLWLLYGANPFIVIPSHFPHDPWIGLMGEWKEISSGYSPLWEVLALIPGWLTEPAHFGWHVFGLKLISLAAYAASLFLVDRLLRAVWPEERAWRLLFFAWNPLVLLEWVGNGHNDSVMVAFLLLSVWLLVRGRDVMAHTALALATLVKVTPLFLWPLLWLWGVKQRSRWVDRLRYTVWVGGIFLGTAAVFALFLWPDPTRWQALHESDFAGRSPQALAILLGMALEIPHAFSRAQMVFRAVFLLGYAGVFVWALRAFPNARESRPITLVHAWLAVLVLLVALFASNWRPWYVSWLVALATLAAHPAWYKGVHTWAFTALTGDVFWTNIRWRFRAYFPPLVAHLIGVTWVFGVPLYVGWREKGARKA